MRRLDAYNYPERDADLTGVIERGPHRIKWAVSGNPDGMPLIMSHGGPGGQNKHNLLREIVRAGDELHDLLAR